MKSLKNYFCASTYGHWYYKSAINTDVYQCNCTTTSYLAPLLPLLYYYHGVLVCWVSQWRHRGHSVTKIIILCVCWRWWCHPATDVVAKCKMSEKHIQRTPSDVPRTAELIEMSSGPGKTVTEYDKSRGLRKSWFFFILLTLKNSTKTPIPVNSQVKRTKRARCTSSRALHRSRIRHMRAPVSDV